MAKRVPFLSLSRKVDFSSVPALLLASALSKGEPHMPVCECACVSLCVSLVSGYLAEGKEQGMDPVG